MTQQNMAIWTEMATLWAQQNNDKTDAVVEISVIWSAEENPPPNVIMLRMAIVVAMRFYPKRTKKWCSLFAMTLSEHRAPPKIDAWSWASSFPLKIALSGDPSETPYFPTEIIWESSDLFRDLVQQRCGAYFGHAVLLCLTRESRSTGPQSIGLVGSEIGFGVWWGQWVRESLNCENWFHVTFKRQTITKCLNIIYIYTFIDNYTHIILDVPPWSSFSW